MSMLSDALLDEGLLLGSPSRIREGIARLAEAVAPDVDRSLAPGRFGVPEDLESDFLAGSFRLPAIVATRERRRDKGPLLTERLLRPGS